MPHRSYSTALDPKSTLSYTQAKQNAMQKMTISSFRQATEHADQQWEGHGKSLVFVRETM